ncbi:MAG: hypothetical protein KC931_05925 [Candidatus Omnitrophica bacterium]|nr:hypothetical protein [Candidatus Omnitrophota bacterium]
MEENRSQSFATPAWLQPMPNLWETFLIHFRRILKWTLVVMVITAGITLVLPKTYRSTTLVLVLPPRYADSLEIPPQSLAMPTVQAIATSYPVLQDLLADLAVKRSIVEKLSHRLGSGAKAASAITESASQAASILEVPLNDAFEKAWRGMPDSNLAKGFDGFSDKEIDELDPNELSEYLNARINTTLETNLTTEYQPMLTLSADWRTPESSALLSFLWAKAVVRALEDEMVQESVRIQEEKMSQWDRMVGLYKDARKAPYEYLAYHPLDIWKSEMRGRDRAGVSATPESEEAGSDLSGSIREAEAELERLRDQYLKTSEELDYFLEDLGGIEAKVEDYPTVLRTSLLSTPKPPKKKIRPRRAAIVLSVGAVTFFLLLGYFQVEEFRRAARLETSS